MEDVLDGIGVFPLVLHSLEAFAVITEKECEFSFKGVSFLFWMVVELFLDGLHSIL